MDPEKQGGLLVFPGNEYKIDGPVSYIPYRDRADGIGDFSIFHSSKAIRKEDKADNEFTARLVTNVETSSPDRENSCEVRREMAAFSSAMEIISQYMNRPVFGAVLLLLRTLDKSE